jgi:WhiB family redox-sensing transcriptional regulator
VGAGWLVDGRVTHRPSELAGNATGRGPIGMFTIMCRRTDLDPLLTRAGNRWATADVFQGRHPFDVGPGTATTGSSSDEHGTDGPPLHTEDAATAWMADWQLPPLPPGDVLPQRRRRRRQGAARSATVPRSPALPRVRLEHRIDHGVWGGCSERERRRILMRPPPHRRRRLTPASARRPPDANAAPSSGRGGRSDGEGGRRAISWWVGSVGVVAGVWVGPGRCALPRRPPCGQQRAQRRALQGSSRSPACPPSPRRARP